MSELKRVALFWGNWGPYHHARFRALREAGARQGVEVIGYELYASSGYYAWKTHETAEGVVCLNLGKVETEFRPHRYLREVFTRLAALRPEVVLVPSYWNWSLFINYSARILGARIVMMNESHAGTEKATGWRRAVKRAIVSQFHGALIGGTPHARHFAALGLRSDRIFPGYDVIDNGYFASRAEAARAHAAAERDRLALPERYFLSLGRMVEKKNLPTLVSAFAAAVRAGSSVRDLVFVGSGDREEALRRQARDLGLEVVDTPASAPTATGKPGRVLFYGFRQIDENPVFYALASAFILPSVSEEWGLVVNEAMACGLPVLVSRVCGCAEDLVAPGENGFLFDPDSADELTQGLLAVARDDGFARRLGAASARRIAAWDLGLFGENGLRAARAALRR